MLITRGYGTCAGDGPGGTLVLADGLNVSLQQSPMEALILSDNIGININKELYSININRTPLVNVDVDNNDIDLKMKVEPISIKLSGGSIIVPEGDIMRKICAENVGGHRMVTVDENGEILHADKDLILDGKQTIGMTLQAALQGDECELAISGDEVTEPSWNWITTSSIYLGDDGVLTQIAPTTGFVLIVAVPLTSTSIRVRIEMPIFL